MHPLEGRNLIQKAVVAGGVVRRFFGELGMGEKAEDGEPVVDAYKHHAVASQAFAIEVVAGGGAAVITAAVNPQHHRLARFGGPLWRPDIEEEAVFLAGLEHAAV